jgi:hypothetical protein
VALRAVDARPTPDLAHKRRVPGWVTLGDLVPSTEPHRVWTPEHSLLAALLRDALRTVLDAPARTTERKQKERANDVRWLRGAAATVSFADVCAYLHLDPDGVRRLVRRAGGDENV